MRAACHPRSHVFLADLGTSTQTEFMTLPLEDNMANYTQKYYTINNSSKEPKAD